MTEEYESILKNDIWEIVLRPEGKSIVTSKWIFKIKHVADESVEKYKARFVARGFSQREGVDYDETFAPVARFTPIRTVISLALAMRWRYLHGTIGYGLRYSTDSDMHLVDRIGQEACRIGRVLPNVVSVWDLLLFPGSVGSRLQWL